MKSVLFQLHHAVHGLNLAEDAYQDLPKTWPRNKGKVQLLGIDGSDLESGDERSMKRSNPTDEALKPLFAKGMYPSNSEVLTALKSANVEGQFAKVFSRWNPMQRESECSIIPICVLIM